MGEIALAAFFAIRMLSDLDVNETSDELAMFLKNELFDYLICPRPARRLAAREIDKWFHRVTGAGVPRRMRYSDSQGRKQFLARLRMTDNSMQFDVTPRGSGSQGRGVSYYAPIAAIMLIRQIAGKHDNDARFLGALGQAVTCCGELHLIRQITLTNHSQLVSSVLDITAKVARSEQAVDNDTPALSFFKVLNEAREFVTMMTVITYSDRQSQRCPPTFVTVACGMLSHMYNRRKFFPNDEFSMGDAATFLGHLNMFWMADSFGTKLPVAELAEHMRALAYAYHLTDDQIASWHNMLRNCAGDESPIGRLVAYFDRIVEPIALIWGGNLFERLQNWVMLLCDINQEYHQMMENREWIAELDAVLDRCGQDTD